MTYEPERFELYAEPLYDFACSRRDLFGMLGAGLLFALKGGAVETRSSRLHISADGTVTAMTGKVEIGQGARTLLAQCVAEELRVPVSSVRMVMADTALVPDDGGTWGSLTSPQTVPAVRMAAAAVREALLDLAAARWNADRASLRADGGAVVAADGRRVTYGELAQAGTPVREALDDPPLTPPAEWKVLGQSVPAVNGRDIVTGALRYPSDRRVAGMLHGRVIRPPGLRASLASFDAGAALRLPGVRVVREGDFLGVVAADPVTAERAARLVRATWTRRPIAVRAEDLSAHFLKTSVPPKPGTGGRYPSLVERGEAQAALKAAPLRHQSEYTTAYIAHVALEPRSAIAHWTRDDGGESLTVHCGTQAPFAVRQELADAFGLAPDRVRVVVADVGSGYGGKHRGEVELEAARLARDAGKPVRVAWTRQEETVRAYARPAALVTVESGFSESGELLAWVFRNYNSGASSLQPPYAIPHFRCEFHRADSPLPQGSYRSLAAVANTFARESHVDEIAARLRIDPLDLRLRNLEGPRMRETLLRAAERFGWGKRTGGNGSGFGLACNREKDGHLSLMVEVEAGPPVRVVRMVMAFDGGAALNPDNLRNQITGALVQGLGGALFERLRFDASGILNGRLSAYRVPRFADIPQIEVILIDRRDVRPAGAGESPITPVAPAIAAALFDATGKRFRALPLASG